MFISQEKGVYSCSATHHIKGNWKVPSSCSRNTWSFGWNMLRVYTHSSVQLCFSLQNWTARYYPHVWKHTDSLFDFRMIWAVDFCPAPHSDFKFSRWGRGMSTLGEAYRISPGDVCVCGCALGSKSRFFTRLRISRGQKEVFCFCRWKQICASTSRAVLVVV